MPSHGPDWRLETQVLLYQPVPSPVSVSLSLGRGQCCLSGHKHSGSQFGELLYSVHLTGLWVGTAIDPCWNSFICKEISISRGSERGEGAEVRFNPHETPSPLSPGSIRSAVKWRGKWLSTYEAPTVCLRTPFPVTVVNRPKRQRGRHNRSHFHRYGADWRRYVACPKSHIQGKRATDSRAPPSARLLSQVQKDLKAPCELVGDNSIHKVPPQPWAWATERI